MIWELAEPRLLQDLQDRVAIGHVEMRVIGAQLLIIQDLPESAEEAGVGTAETLLRFTRPKSD